jgi:hypothetical protein
MMVEHMKFYYLDSPCVGVDGSACVLYLRSDSDAYTDDIDYARRFETRAEAEKYRDVNGLTVMVGCASDNFKFGSKSDEAYQFAMFTLNVVSTGLMSNRQKSMQKLCGNAGYLR